MMRYEGTIYPKIQQIIKKTSEAWQPHWSGDVDLSLFAASNGIEKFLVSLKEHTCSCKKWELTRIPCPYSIACKWLNGVKPEVSVISYYNCCFLLLLCCFWIVCGSCFKLKLF